MPGEDKAPPQTRHRKKGKKSRPKDKSPGGSPVSHLGDSLDAQDGFLLSPPLQSSPKKVVDKRPKVSVAKLEEESSAAICLQVLVPYLLAGMGMVMAGMVLDNVQVSPPTFSGSLPLRSVCIFVARLLSPQNKKHNQFNAK